LTVEDIIIPAVCPVLGIVIVYNKTGFHPSSPSLDKVVPELGYVPHNIRVISNRANRLKHDATPAELRKVAIYAYRETLRVQRGA
jgi:hypothetical protein